MWYYVKIYGHLELIATDVDASIGRAFERFLAHLPFTNHHSPFCYLIVIASLLQFLPTSFVIHPTQHWAALQSTY